MLDFLCTLVAELKINKITHYMKKVYMNKKILWSIIAVVLFVTVLVIALKSVPEPNTDRNANNKMSSTQEAVFASQPDISSNNDTFIVNPYNMNLAEFVGYDGSLPILVLREYDKVGKYKSDSCIYKYANGNLTEIQISKDKNQKLLLVKDGVYVLGDKPDNDSIKFQFKLNGKDIISELKLKLKMLPIPTHVVMNKETLFILDQNNDSTIILKTKYRFETNGYDTIVSMKGKCNGILDATYDYLYYAIQDSESIGPLGNVYQIDLKNGTTDIIIGNIATLTMAFGQNLICDHILFDGDFHFLLIDYKKQKYAISPSKSGSTAEGAFYSFEYDAFVFYNFSSNINKWENLLLSDVIEWKSFTNPLLNPNVKEQPTGPKLVQLISG